MEENKNVKFRKAAGQTLRALRKQQGLSAVALCDALAAYGQSVKPQYLSKWELGQQGIPLPAATALCEFFHVTLGTLYGEPAQDRRYTDDEADLIERYRRLTVNSKQIVSTLVDMELNHIRANEQGEKQILIFPGTRTEYAAAVSSSDASKRIPGPPAPAAAKEDAGQAALPTAFAQNKPRKKAGELIKVFDQPAAAGLGSYVDDDSFEEVRVSAIPMGAEFGVRIQGDSMTPAVLDGDIAFVHRQPQLDVGETGIFTYNGDTYCKQLCYRGGRYYLHSVNPKYKDIPLDSELESFYVIGKVIGTAREEE